MASYAALICLKNTIEHILNSSRISLVPPSPQIINHAYKEVQPLLQTLGSSSSSSKWTNALDAEIRDAVSKFEDLLQSHLVHQISSQFEILHPLEIPIDLQDLRQDVESFAETVKKLHQAYGKELDSPFQEEEEEEEGVSLRNVSKMVGFSDALNQIRTEFTKPWPLFVMALEGMAGIGKTTLAREVCNDPSIRRDFEHIVWVKIGQKYELNQIASDIVAQVNPKMGRRPMDGDESGIDEYLRECLKGKRCLIVLDDAWDRRVFKCLFNSLIKAKGESYRILLTTRLQEIAESMRICMDLLNKEESWDLLRDRVFGEDCCPYHLERAGRKIAENCDGLPLTIVMVAHLLSTNMSPQHWRAVAERRRPFFPELEDKISKVLRPSYDYLPQHLRLYFLSMGVFPENFAIHPNKLINLWAAEGFLEPNKSQTLQECGIECLEDLFSKNLVVVIKKSSHPYMSFGNYLKTCCLHPSFWQFCNREAMSNKFFHALDNHGLVGVKGQHLCIQNNILCTIKDEYKSVLNSCALSARSLLCYAPSHRYQVPINFGLMRLLRVLDALTIRFYDFPVEVVKLVQLKYLALTCNDDLPPSISNLWVLQFLIICRYSSIKSSGDPTYVPMEIWDMQELKHIQIMGNNLPKYSNGDCCLRNLLTLLGVSAHSCTEEVFKRIPNLEELGIRIELVPDDDHSDEPFCRLNQISHLHKLTSLKCVVVNPELRSEALAPPAPLSMFPPSLRKLHLSGMGYPWEYMKIIGLIPCLYVLKLRNYAFQGPIWEIQGDAFRLLHFLIIEDTDLVQWKVGNESLGHLVHASIKHCYKLEQIDWESNFCTDKVEIVDCNPLGAECLNQIKSRNDYRFTDLGVHSSWDDV